MFGSRVFVPSYRERMARARLGHDPERAPIRQHGVVRSEGREGVAGCDG